MSSNGIIPYTFTDAQKVDIRRFCGFESYGTGTVVFPFPWIERRYLALEYRMNSTTPDEATVLTSIILPNLYSLELAVPLASANLATDSAGPWVHNKNEVKDRVALFQWWRRYLCSFLGIPPGPGLVGGGANRQIVV
jgi:hypothetical protein